MPLNNLFIIFFELVVYSSVGNKLQFSYGIEKIKISNLSMGDDTPTPIYYIKPS